MRCVKCKKTGKFRPWEGEMERFGVQYLGRGSQCECGEILFSLEQMKAMDKAVAGELAKRGISNGKELKFLRKEAGLTGQALAELLDVTPKTVSRWETGESSIPKTIAFTVMALVDQPKKTRRVLAALSEA